MPIITILVVQPKSYNQQNSNNSKMWNDNREFAKTVKISLERMTVTIHGRVGTALELS